jgi:hypothetical protein
MACHTVNIYLLLGHELPEALQAGGCVDLLHVDRASQRWRCGEGPDGQARRVGDCARKGPEHESGYDRGSVYDGCCRLMQAYGYSKLQA